MKIGIDISQTAYKGTGVGNYVTQLVQHLLEIDDTNEYILFFSSLRKNCELRVTSDELPKKFHGSQFTVHSKNLKVEIKKFKFPPALLDLLWNRLHIFPIEWFIGDVDVFISSDWTQPPTVKAKKATILYDLIVYTYPEETDRKIVQVHKKRLQWVKKECDMIFCISDSTKKDAMKILGLEEKRLHVIYAGV